MRNPKGLGIVRHMLQSAAEIAADQNLPEETRIEGLKAGANLANALARLTGRPKPNKDAEGAVDARLR